MIFQLLSGIGLFLLGMRLLTDRLKALAGRAQQRGGEIVLAYAARPQAPDELATAVEVAEAHVAAGRTYGPEPPHGGGRREERPPVLINSGPSPPPEAFTAVPYRGCWYWIADTRLPSRRSLTFLLLFVSLAETGVTPEGPVPASSVHQARSGGGRP